MEGRILRQLLMLESSTLGGKNVGGVRVSTCCVVTDMIDVL